MQTAVGSTQVQMGRSVVCMVMRNDFWNSNGSGAFCPGDARFGKYGIFTSKYIKLRWISDASLRGEKHLVFTLAAAY
jgi:hypothetical protein